MSKKKTPEEKKEAKRKSDRRYYYANQEKMVIRAREWYKNNKERARKRNKEYNLKNRDKRIAYYSSPVVKESRRKYMKKWRASRIEHRKKYMETWRTKNIEHVKNYSKKYKEEHPFDYSKSKLATLAYEKRKMKEDVNFWLRKILRRRLSHAIKHELRTGSAVRDLGCSISELKAHLESKFKNGMSWENKGYKGWHIDHIIPLSSFDLTKREQLLVACHYTNLQPLWWKENIRKGNRITK